MRSDKVNYHVVDEEDAGSRLDNLLIRLLKGVPKSHIYRIIRSGEVRVDGKRAEPALKVGAGCEIRVPPVRIAEVGRGGKFTPPRHFEIVHEDEGLLVVNKPSGVAVHGGSGVDYGVIEQLRAARRPVRHLELVHRLDRETSGLLMIAKKRSVLRALHAQFRERLPRKTYLALSDGPWDPGVERIDCPLRRYELPTGERIVKPHPDGAPASTRFEILEDFGRASLLRVDLLTGRTHQIRVHMSRAGRPVVNDDKYGNDERNRAWRAMGLKRLFLHAWRLEVVNPLTDLPLVLTAEPPTELGFFLAELRRRR